MAQTLQALEKPEPVDFLSMEERLWYHMDLQLEKYEV